MYPRHAGLKIDTLRCNTDKLLILMIIDPHGPYKVRLRHSVHSLLIDKWLHKFTKCAKLHTPIYNKRAAHIAKHVWLEDHVACDVPELLGVYIKRLVLFVEWKQVV
jgi:hypothetical protein